MVYLMDRLVLASQSPRRKQLLEWAGIDFEVVISDADENFPNDMPVVEVPIWIARKKANAVLLKTGTQQKILAADTIVVLGNEIIGKPVDRSDAMNILTKLSGKKHLVISGVIIRSRQKEIAFADQTEVWFHDLSK